jgi:adenosylmethionine-8-amino-7-oxononanoate aminotransferase
MLVCAAVAGLATALPAAAQFQRPDDAVKYRKAAFQVMAAHFGRIGAMANGRVPFDGAAAAANAEVVAFVSNLPFAGFVEGTSGTDKGAPLAKVFYADNGSAGVEVALKMAFHWYRNRGDEPRRTKFVALTNSYHGETVGALSVGDIPLYRRVYAPLLMEVLFAPTPDAFGSTDAQAAAARAEDAADALARLLDAHPGEVCALILEPLVQCAGGMRMHHPVYLQRVRDLCDAHGVFLIADEIATGFGRTGSLFAFEQAGVQPDLMCLSKGLTGGFLPLCAVLATQEIYDGFLDDSRERAFLHSHSYSGNPLACAAALASLDILQQDDVIARNRGTAAKMAALAAPFAAHPLVAEVRQTGMILAIELRPEPENADDGNAVEIAGRRGLRMYRAALDRGVLLRPLGDVLYWMPPYCVDDAQLAQLADATHASIEEAARCA